MNEKKVLTPGEMAHRAYMRRWRAENRAHVIEYSRAYWERKAQEAKNVRISEQK